MKPEVTIYTDGASSGSKGGPGGWAAILLFGEHRREIAGWHPDTTNQRMEVQAAIEGLKALKKPCRVKVISDSGYLVNCMMQRWHVKWASNGWVNAERRPVANQDLWEELVAVAALHEVTFVHIKGHRGDPLNERADFLAVTAKKDRSNR